MPELADTLHNRWLTTLTVDSGKLGVSAAEVIEHLAQSNIEARPVWKPMHMQPLFEGCDYFSEDEDNARYLFESGVCLPSDTKMTVVEQKRVIEEIQNIVKS